MRKLSSLSAVSLNFVRGLHKHGAIKIGVLDVPFEKGQDKKGVADGPKHIRNAGLLTKLIEHCGNVDVKDYGTLTYDNYINQNVEVENMRHYCDVVCCSKVLSNKVEEILKDGRICLTLGGDHSIGIGTVSGHLKSKANDVAVLWIDAHADLNTNQTSFSGNVHGMPIAVLAREMVPYWPPLPGMDWFEAKLSMRNLSYIGLRSVDPYENAIMHKLGISCFDMYDVERYGIDAVVSAALDKMDPDHKKSIHVSFDIDSLDPMEAPSTGTAVRGGLLLREGIHIMAAVHKTGRLGAMDLVEVNPSIGTPADVEKTVTAAIHVILAAFGHNKRAVKPDLPELVPQNGDKINLR